MSAATPRPPRWKRRIRWILAVAGLLPVVLFLAGNALLATPWARGKLAAKVTARTGLEATIGRAWWTPWGGAGLGELVLRQPPPLRGTVEEPLLKVAAIRVRPRWGRLLLGELRIDRIAIEQPEVVLSLELAASLVSAGAAEPAPTAAPPLVAAAESRGEKPVPDAAAPAGPQAAITPPVAASKASTAGTAWLEVKGGRFELRLSGARLARVSAVEGQIPFSGAPASGNCRIGEIESLGRVLGRDVTLPLAWRAPELRCDGAALRLAGAEVKLSAVAGLMRGLPFAVDIAVPEQALDASDLFQSLRPLARRGEARVQGRGLLRFPVTWQGAAAAAAEGVTLQLAAEPLAFDEGRASLVLLGGVLQCPDIRLTGDRVSFLGNGQIRTDGQGTGVLRAVVPPDVAEAWTRRLTVQGRGPVFAPMETPDRRFIDLRWISYPGGHGIELGAGGPVIPVADIGQLFFPVAAN